MAIILTSQIIENGFRNGVVKITNETTATGNETLALKVDATSTGPYGVIIQGQTFYPGIGISLQNIQYNVQNMLVDLKWDATTPVDLMLLNGFGCQDFNVFGGLEPPNVAGATGSILLSTIGATAGSSYSIILNFNKAINQNTGGAQPPSDIYYLTEDGLIFMAEDGSPFLIE